MSREMVDQDTADQVMNSFKVLAGDKVAYFVSVQSSILLHVNTCQGFCLHICIKAVSIPILS